jgi:dihydropyrimidinase
MGARVRPESLYRDLPAISRDAGKTGQKTLTSFRWVPNGIPGVAARLPILFSEGVVTGRISLQDFVALTATNHAKLYWRYPRKGSIMIGADADIAIWDAEKKTTLTQDLMQHGSDYTPYERLEVTGWPIKTLVRGVVVTDSGRVVGSRGFGQFLPRETSRHL